MMVRLDDGTSVVVADSGPTDQLVSVVAVPGLKGTDLGLQQLCTDVNRHGLRIATINLPGNGVSASPQFCQWDLHQVAALVEQVISKLPCREAIVLLGHSVGATVIMHVASHGRTNVGALVLLSPIVVSSRRRSGAFGAASRWLSRLAVTILEATPAIADAAVRSNMVDAVSNGFLARQGIRGFLRIQTRSRPERAFAPDPRAVARYLVIAGSHGCIDDADGIDAPTLLVAGDKDPFAAPDELRLLSSALPQCQLVLAPGAGHLLHHEDPELVGELIARYVARLQETLDGESPTRALPGG
jgi:pimeloyl-ACP methyl ester carboxylesterase